MAQQVNKLDTFQSHSIHYAVLAARSTEDIRVFTETSDKSMSSTLLAIDGAKQLGDQINVPGSNTTGVFLMLDTRRFSQFTISDFSMATNMAGFTTPGAETPNSSSQEMSFTVLDSMGISFANFLQYLMDKKLQVSYQGMVLLIRIMFIGHRENGTTEVIQSVGIPAIFADIQVDLNETKGIYTCKLYSMVGMVSNAQNNSMWTAIGTASSYFTGAGANTLGAVINSFEARLNEESLKRYSQFNARSTSIGDGSTSLPRFGRPVQYMITLPKGWGEYKFSGPTQGGAVEVNFKQLLREEEIRKATDTVSQQQKKTQQNVIAPAKDSFVAVNPELTITEILDVIFKQCVQIALLGNFSKAQNKTADLRFYKHLITVTSDESSYTVHIDVVEYIVPNVELNEKPGTNTTTSVGEYDTQLFEERNDNGRIIKVPKNYLEFDYIFSGKNLDVLQLDLKLEKLNVILMQGSRLGTGQMFSTADEAQIQKDGESVGSDRRTAPGMLAKDPVLLPKRSGDERTNFANIGANIQDEDGNSPQSIRQQYIKNLSDLINVGPVKAKMTIRGNPDLFERVTLNSLPQHVSSITVTNEGGASSSSNASVKEQYRANFEAKLLRLTPGLSQAPGGGFKVDTVLRGPSHVTSPVFIKVNVFGPAVDFITNESANGFGGEFAERLFYNNYYYLFKIISRIDSSSKFTQEFELSPFSVYGYNNLTAKAQASNAVKTI